MFTIYYQIINYKFRTFIYYEIQLIFKIYIASLLEPCTFSSAKKSLLVINSQCFIKTHNPSYKTPKAQLELIELNNIIIKPYSK